MNAPSFTGKRGTAILRVAVGTWLALISAAVLVNHVALSGLASRVDATVPGAQVAVLETRVAELAQQVKQLRQQPESLPQARYDKDRAALEQRLSVIEQAQDERANATDLIALRDRVTQLEARPVPRQAAVPRPQARRAAPAKPKPAVPAFRIVGIEQRAGEPFISILPVGESAPGQLHLLRPGEEEAGWQLEAIERDAAVFRKAGEIHRVTIPAASGGKP